MILELRIHQLQKELIQSKRSIAHLSQALRNMTEEAKRRDKEIYFLKKKIREAKEKKDTVPDLLSLQKPADDDSQDHEETMAHFLFLQNRIDSLIRAHKELVNAPDPEATAECPEVTRTSQNIEEATFEPYERHSSTAGEIGDDSWTDIREQFIAQYGCEEVYRGKLLIPPFKSRSSTLQENVQKEAELEEEYARSLRHLEQEKLEMYGARLPHEMLESDFEDLYEPYTMPKEHVGTSHKADGYAHMEIRDFLSEKRESTSAPQNLTTHRNPGPGLFASQNRVKYTMPQEPVATSQKSADVHKKIFENLSENTSAPQNSTTHGMGGLFASKNFSRHGTLKLEDTSAPQNSTTNGMSGLFASKNFSRHGTLKLEGMEVYEEKVATSQREPEGYSQIVIREILPEELTGSNVDSMVAEDVDNMKLRDMLLEKLESLYPPQIPTTDEGLSQNKKSAATNVNELLSAFEGIRQELRERAGVKLLKMEVAMETDHDSTLSAFKETGPNFPPALGAELLHGQMVIYELSKNAKVDLMNFVKTFEMDMQKKFKDNYEMMQRLLSAVDEVRQEMKETAEIDLLQSDAVWRTKFEETSSVLKNVENLSSPQNSAVYNLNDIKELLATVEGIRQEMRERSEINRLKMELALNSKHDETIAALKEVQKFPGEFESKMLHGQKEVFENILEFSKCTQGQMAHFIKAYEGHLHLFEGLAKAEMEKRWNIETEAANLKEEIAKLNVEMKNRNEGLDELLKGHVNVLSKRVSFVPAVVILDNNRTMAVDKYNTAVAKGDWALFPQEYEVQCGNSACNQKLCLGIYLREDGCSVQCPSCHHITCCLTPKEGYQPFFHSLCNHYAQFPCGQALANPCMTCGNQNGLYFGTSATPPCFGIATKKSMI